MQYLISNEFNKNEYPKCLLHERTKYCVVKIVQILKKKTCTCTCYMPKQIIFYTENSIFEDSKGFKIENNLFVLKEFAICDMKETLIANYIFLPSFNKDQYRNSKGFKIENNLFVLKEFAICDMKETLIANYIFLPSFNKDQYRSKACKLIFYFYFIINCMNFCQNSVGGFYSGKKRKKKKKKLLLNVNDGMQYLISNKLDNDQHLNCFLQKKKSKKFNALRIIQKVLK
ncbi:hypothetical protein V1478_016922 [Vespula squamosa]|uniref:Uncharacterized protein n=1 Tax=Vespula squamosa TaxID=30214 RepID=A0ABD1ZXX7_VESSQ